MSVSIDEMQVETQTPAAASGGQAAAAPRAETDIKSEMERLHERKLRLQAD